MRILLLTLLILPLTSFGYSKMEYSGIMNGLLSELTVTKTASALENKRKLAIKAKVITLIDDITVSDMNAEIKAILKKDSYTVQEGLDTLELIKDKLKVKLGKL